MLLIKVVHEIYQGLVQTLDLAHLVRRHKKLLPQSKYIYVLGFDVARSGVDLPSKGNLSNCYSAGNLK